MVAIISKFDLPEAIKAHELADAMVDGANARASRVAPCLASTDPQPSADQLAEARLVLIGAVKRWAEAGAGSFQTQAAGPFSVGVDTRQRTGFNLWPSEITALQDICSTGVVGREAFSIDTAPSYANALHLPWCSINFGSVCSCGANIAGEPIYELG